MGLNFGKEIVSRSGDRIILEAPVPETKTASEKYWQLWRLHKDDIKKDGFGLKKNKGWSLMYYHEITETTYEIIDGKRRWRVEFEKKIADWTAELNKLDEFLEDRISVIKSGRRAFIANTASTEQHTNKD